MTDCETCRRESRHYCGHQQNKTQDGAHLGRWRSTRRVDVPRYGRLVSCLLGQQVLNLRQKIQDEGEKQGLGNDAVLPQYFCLYWALIDYLRSNRVAQESEVSVRSLSV